ncbi:methyltransferase [Streptomyces sp. H39-S7]|uniref:methyltransferase n=1 Tax=Streptomyces sp. H39-S7 TaxID=3004357 RepID=UPI0022AEE6AF|nr:methyltransferase [Streptomyces sp. H39-S7]MCZ4123213.1 methyltransferase [Streptomyces sp. H39-S7]
MSLLQLAGMGWISRSLSVAARLGIADHLADGPKSPAELAQLTDSDPDGVLYLLRVLGIVGVFKENEDGTFEHTETSQPLRDDHPESMRYWCVLGGEMYYDVWRDLLTTVKTGKPASQSEYGGSIYAYMDQDTDAGEIYDKAMADITRPAAAELARDFDFSWIRKVVDIGGGTGHLLKGILGAHPDVEGVVADRGDVAERGTKELAATGNEDLIRRLTFVESDFFAEVPAGGDAYFLKNVLHNWSPDSSVKILETVRKAMVRTVEDSEGLAAEPVLFVIEPLLGHDNASAIRSLFQMVVCEEGTRIRSEPDMRKQAEGAGFEIRSIKHLSTEHSVVEMILARD